MGTLHCGKFGNRFSLEQQDFCTTILGMFATISGVYSFNEIKCTASPLALAVHCQVGKRVHDISC